MKPKSIYKMILEGEDIRWQTVIYELIRSGKVDPWNLDISILTREFLKVLRNLERMNFRLSGKVVFAAALLLKLKTRELGLDEFILHSEEGYEVPIEEDIEAVEEEQAILEVAKSHAVPQLVSKIPENNTRPVTVFELVSALKKAITVEERRRVRQDQIAEEHKPIKAKLNKVDIYKKIQRVYNKVVNLVQSSNNNLVEFDSLIHSNESKDKIWTFIPLLHLANERKVDLHQEMPFSKIFVELKDQ